MWKVRMSQQVEDLLDSGKQVELIVAEGVLVLQRDEDARLTITFLSQAEAGFGLRAHG